MKTQNQILNWMVDSLNEFTAQLSLSKSRPTVEAYRYDVARFLEYLHSHNVRRMSSIKPTHVMSYLGECKSLGRSSTSIHRYYMAIRCYCKFLRKNRYIDNDITQDISPPKTQQKAPKIPTLEEVSRILQQPNVENESGMRDKAILELLYSSGLRASELCNMEIGDFTRTNVIIKCGKRGKTRTVPITAEASTAITEYISRYRGSESGYLFQTLMGKQIRRQLLCHVVGEYAMKAGVKGVTTHTLRHACATHLLDHGADLRFIQEVLGHSSIASTQRYTHLSSNRMQEMFNQFHPRRRSA